MSATYPKRSQPKTVQSAGSSATIRVRRGPGVHEQRVVPDADWRWLKEGQPWRGFKPYRGQRHFPGRYWASTMTDHVGYESRLELETLLLADFDISIEWIRSQPFQLIQAGGQKHVPDYLLRYRDGRFCVVDVKPQRRLDDDKVVQQFAWTREIVEGRGWEYRVESEHDQVLVQNVRFLAGYRRSFQFDHEEADRAIQLVSEPMSVGSAIRLVAAGQTGADIARGLIMHLLWRQQLRTDLTKLMQSTSVVEPL